MKKILFVSLLSVLLLNNAISDLISETFHANSLEYNTVQSLVNTTNDGDTVYLPEGETTWTSSVVINNDIELRGAGKNKTIITNTGSTETFQIHSNGGVIIITGITIDGNYVSNHLFIKGNSKDFIIYDNIFKNSRSRSLIIEGYSYGVIAQNEFRDNGVTDIVIFGDNDAWDRPVGLGGSDFVFVENNSFIYSGTGNGPTHSISSNHGAKFVFRFNNMQAVYIPADGFHYSAPIDAHGNFYYGRGTLAYEIYGNSIQSERSFRGIFLRGGTGVVYDNNFSGDFEYELHLSNYRSEQTPTGEISGGCTTPDYDPSACDYPAPDQINNLYIWDNYSDGNLIVPVVDDRGLMRQHVNVDRDYFLSQKAGYVQYPYPHPDISLLEETGTLEKPSSIQIDSN